MSYKTNGYRDFISNEILSKISVLSWSGVSIDTLFTDQTISAATGFFYEFNNEIFLITNWHVVTGRNPQEPSKLINGLHSSPTAIMFYTFATHGSWVSNYIDLYDDKHRPVWFEYSHIAHQTNDFDVVAIPISKKEIDDHALIQPVNRIKGTVDEAEIHPGYEVFILGYPLGSATGGVDTINLPIWKRGTIATEPLIDFGGRPCVLLDTATRPGMSGSPVFQLSSQPQFLGIYSGRVGATDEFMASIGILWKKEVIEEITGLKKNGHNPYPPIFEHIENLFVDDKQVSSITGLPKSEWEQLMPKLFKKGDKLMRHYYKEQSRFKRDEIVEWWKNQQRLMK